MFVLTAASPLALGVRCSPLQIEAFFNANSLGLVGCGYAASTVPYEMFPRYFTWHGSTGSWVGRSQSWVTKVGRVRWVHPQAGDIFYMRRLLLSSHGLGRTSFVDLRTVRGRVFDTYRDAAICLGLTDDDSEFHHAMAECASVRSPARLRSFFVSIMCMKVVDAPDELLLEHFDALTEDWRTNARQQHGWMVGLPDDDRLRAVWALLAADLWRLVTASGEDLTSQQLGLPAHVEGDRVFAVGVVARNVTAGLWCGSDALAIQRGGAAAMVAFDPAVSARRAVAVRDTLDGGLLSDEQEAFMAKVMVAVDMQRILTLPPGELTAEQVERLRVFDDLQRISSMPAGELTVAEAERLRVSDVEGRGGLFFLSAGAGSGKTMTLSLLIHELRALKVRVRAMATSGIAATLLPEPAMTMHRGLRVPLRLDGANTRLDLFAAERLGDRLQVFLDQVLVLDEACMSHVDVACAMDRDLREIALPKSRGGHGREFNESDMMYRRHPSQLPFGGKVVVWAGHWAQTLPIVPGGTRADTREACLFRRYFWGSVQQHRLTKNFRLGSDPSVDWYATFLRGISDGSDSVSTDPVFGQLPPGGGVQTLPRELVQCHLGSGLAGWVYEVCRCVRLRVYCVLISGGLSGAVFRRVPPVSSKSSVLVQARMVVWRARSGVLISSSGRIARSSLLTGPPRMPSMLRSLLCFRMSGCARRLRLLPTRTALAAMWVLGMVWSS